MYMQELVSYHEDFCNWVNQVTYAVNVILADTGTDVEYEIIYERLKDNGYISQDPDDEEEMDIDDIIDDAIDL